MSATSANSATPAIHGTPIKAPFLDCLIDPVLRNTAVDNASEKTGAVNITTFQPGYGLNTPGQPFYFGTVPRAVSSSTPMGPGSHFNTSAGVSHEVLSADWNRRLAEIQAEMVHFQVPVNAQQDVMAMPNNQQGPHSILNKQSANLNSPPGMATLEAPLAGLNLSSDSPGAVVAGTGTGTHTQAGSTPPNGPPGSGDTGMGGVAGILNPSNGTSSSGPPGDINMADPGESDENVVAILKPKGEAGNKKNGYNLFQVMRWKNKREYSAFLAAVRNASSRAGIKAHLTYKQLDPEMVGNVCRLVAKEWPYVNKKRFPGGWPIKEALKMHINNRRSYKNRRGRRD
ncbi:hypothetical protein V5O48_016727 [Marasmius crinis-equi]|uniref:Uncharacterized protein n=1 Tax=Marasmius crinis-equi TaxID=585013 RepID=A0ABR3ER74_9AGAR